MPALSDYAGFYVGSKAVERLVVGSSEVWSATVPEVVFVSASERAGGTNMTVSLPAGVQDGDLLLYVITNANNTGQNAGSVSTPEGHTLHANIGLATGLRIITQNAGAVAGQPGQAFVNSSHLFGQCFAFRNVDLANRFGGVAIGNNNGFTHPQAYPAITPAFDGAVLRVLTYGQTTTAPTYPSWGQVDPPPSSLSGSFPVQRVDFKVVAAGETEAAVNAVSGVNRQYVTMSIALKVAE